MSMRQELIQRITTTSVKFSSNSQNSTEWIKPDDATFVYPCKIPTSDINIKEGIREWRSHVSKQGWCPFIHSFGEKYTIDVERSNQSTDWIRHVYTFLGNSEVNTALIVLPSLHIPTPEHLGRLFQLPYHTIPLNLFGEQLNQFRHQLTYPHIIRCDRPGAEGSLHDVAFHPCITNSSWAPWPVIQLVKADVMQKAEEWYAQKNSGCPVSKIIFDNNSKFREIISDEKKLYDLQKSRIECYRYELKSNR